ncbi:hypothetical protein BH23PLA1_BH23PLA1_40600 [soil metagenome]
MSQIDLTAQFVQDFQELEDQVQRLRERAPEIPTLDPTLLSKFNAERDDLRRQLNEAQESLETQARRQAAEQQQLVQDLKLAREHIEELETRLREIDATRTLPPPPGPVLDDQARLREELASVRFQLTLAQSETRKLRTENHWLREEINGSSDA